MIAEFLGNLINWCSDIFLTMIDWVVIVLDFLFSAQI